MKLARSPCKPCSGASSPLSDEEALELLQEIPHWLIKPYEGEKHLVRTYVFDAYADGLRFTIGVGEMADAVDHHPTLITAWGKVSVHWWTHVLHGLHKNDFIMAARTDELYEELTGSP